MLGCIYCFERVLADDVTSASQATDTILKAATHGVRGIRFHELTDPKNPKPLFAVLFANTTAKEYFEDMLACLLEANGLRATVLTPVERSPVEPTGQVAAGAANSTEFEQARAAHGHHSMPPSVQEWTRTHSG